MLNQPAFQWHTICQGAVAQHRNSEKAKKKGTNTLEVENSGQAPRIVATQSLHDSYVIITSLV